MKRADHGLVSEKCRDLDHAEIALKVMTRIVALDDPNPESWYGQGFGLGKEVQSVAAESPAAAKAVLALCIAERRAQVDRLRNELTALGVEA